MKDKSSYSKKQLNEPAYTISPIPEGKKFRKRKPFVQDWVEAILFAFVVAISSATTLSKTFMIPLPRWKRPFWWGIPRCQQAQYYLTIPSAKIIVTFRYPKSSRAHPKTALPQRTLSRSLIPIYITKRPLSQSNRLPSSTSPIIPG
jgi:hypothetical protein